MKPKNPSRAVVGIVPAGGQASRLSPLPCSKEVYPIGFRRVGDDGAMRPKVVCHYLLERMRLAGVAKAYVIIRKGKWDLPAYFEDGKMVGMPLAWLMMDQPFGVPYTVDQAEPFIGEAIEVFGFPDIIFQPDEAFEQLLARQAATDADVVLGLFKANQPHQVDMVDQRDDGRVNRIQIKPERTSLRYTWLIAVWQQRFTRFMHDYVTADRKRREEKRLKATVTDAPGKELFIGDVIQRAIEEGMRIDSVAFDDGQYFDIGSPEDIARFTQQLQHLDLPK